MFDVTPVLSTSSVNCGPVCLKMLLSYYGKDVDLKELEKDCSLSINGCNGKNLMQAGRKHGLDMTAWGEISPEDIAARNFVGAKVIKVDILKQDRPAIIWWKYNHFVVFCGLDDAGKVVICNPNRGRYSVSQSLFKALYSGVCFCNGEPKELEEGEE